MNLETGDLFKCIGNPYLDNIYDICKDIKFEQLAINANYHIVGIAILIWR